MALRVAEGVLPRRSGELPERSGELPARSGEVVRPSGELPRRSGELPRHSGQSTALCVPPDPLSSQTLMPGHDRPQHDHRHVDQGQQPHHQRQLGDACSADGDAASRAAELVLGSGPPQWPALAPQPHADINDHTCVPDGAPIPGAAPGSLSGSGASSGSAGVAAAADHSFLPVLQAGRSAGPTHGSTHNPTHGSSFAQPSGYVQPPSWQAG